MLTQADLDGMRTDFDESLPDEATIFHQPMESDGQGGMVPVGDPTQTTVAARLSPLRNPYAESVFADRLGGQIGWMLTLPWGTAIDLADTIRFTFLETMDIKNLQILGVMDPRTFNVATRLACMEVL